jgi:hypothetical protein
MVKGVCLSLCGLPNVSHRRNLADNTAGGDQPLVLGTLI